MKVHDPRSSSHISILDRLEEIIEDALRPAGRDWRALEVMRDLAAGQRKVEVHIELDCGKVVMICVELRRQRFLPAASSRVQRGCGSRAAC